MRKPKLQLKVFLLIGLFWMSCGVLLGQNKQGNIWYFGHYAGVDFNSGSPVALTNSAMNQQEGSSSIADSLGSLLFYTDGITVWNKQHQPMPNGTGLNGSITSTQSALIVPMPGNSSLYYIFTSPADWNSCTGITSYNFSIVDMNLDSARGDIINKNSILYSGCTTEKLAATTHSNGHDIWIAIHEGNSSTFYSFLITSSGINPAVISNVGTFYNSGLGYLKFSQAGNKAVAVSYFAYGLDIFDFDKTTGLFSNPITLPGTLPKGGYGAEFSPSGAILYVSLYDNGPSSPWHIFQFNMNAGSASAIISSATIVYYFINDGAALAAAPDGKIYFVSKLSSHWLGVINNPDSIGNSCNVDDSAVFLGNASCSYGLPNFISNIYFPISSIPSVNLMSSDTTFCEKHCIDFTDFSTNNPTSWQWFFPGADSTTSTLQNPTNICYNNYGSFDVTLIACNAAGCDTLYLPGFINEYQTLTPVITQSNDTLFSSPGVAYQWWSVDSGIITGATNNYFIPAQGGSYYVIVTDSNGCAGASNTIIITAINSPLERGWGCVITPNPNQGSFTITLSTSVHKDFSIRIINAMGQTVFKKQEARGKGQEAIEINLPNAIPGLYTVEVITREKVYRQKFVVATLPK